MSKLCLLLLLSCTLSVQAQTFSDNSITKQDFEVLKKSSWNLLSAYYRKEAYVLQHFDSAKGRVIDRNNRNVEHFWRPDQYYKEQSTFSIQGNDFIKFNIFCLNPKNPLHYFVKCVYVEQNAQASQKDTIMTSLTATYHPKQSWSLKIDTIARYRGRYNKWEKMKPYQVTVRGKKIVSPNLNQHFFEDDVMMIKWKDTIYQKGFLWEQILQNDSSEVTVTKINHDLLLKKQSTGYTPFSVDTKDCNIDEKTVCWVTVKSKRNALIADSTMFSMSMIVDNIELSPMGTASTKDTKHTHNYMVGIQWRIYEGIFIDNFYIKILHWKNSEVVINKTETTNVCNIYLKKEAMSIALYDVYVSFYYKDKLYEKKAKRQIEVTERDAKGVVDRKADNLQIKIFPDPKEDK